jgi:hypothetical protein
MIKAQIQQRIRAVGQNKNWKKALPGQGSPAHQRRIFHGVRLAGVCRKRFEEEPGSKLPRAIPASHSLKRRAFVALCWARRLRDNSQKYRRIVPLACNSERRKEAHKLAQRRVPRESPDSPPAAASSRIEFASSLASVYYATPAARPRQPDCRLAFRTANASVAVAVRVFVNDHFAGERAINVSKVSRGQNDSEDPPGQSDF